MTGQEIGVIVIVGAAVAYVLRKFVLPRKQKGGAATFVSIQQIKSKPKR